LIPGKTGTESFSNIIGRTEALGFLARKSVITPSFSSGASVQVEYTSFQPETR
jgi:hypothetical protein